MSGRNKGQLAGKIAQSRSRQAFDKRLAVIAFAELCGNEEMAGSAEPIFKWLVPRDLDRFNE
jgi:hypothetical protein